MRHGDHFSMGMIPKIPEEREKMARISYDYAIRSLMYYMLCTRPNITYAISLTSKFQSDP